MKWGQRVLPGVLVVLAAGLIYVIASHVFPFHTPNHDEAVYLHQAEMLLEGRLFISPPVPDAFRPWFFVDDGSRLYPRYTPIPAGMFAIGKLLGGFRLSLAVIAGINIGLTFAVLKEVFDRRTGLVGAGFLLVSPLFLVQSAVFLPYTATMMWNLVFAYAYFRADRTESWGWAMIAGVAIGIAFFSRQYTAILFAVPFIGHAIWTLKEVNRQVILRQGLIAFGGVGGVILALGYNTVVTGSPLVFPFEAFAPRDGLGFGSREILGYERDYTPALAIRANSKVIAAFFIDWVGAGLLGSLLMVMGIGVWLGQARRRLDPRQAVPFGLFVSIILGNIYFWGNLNLLGSIEDPNDGLIRLLGPYYHVDLLLPTVGFAAVGAITIVTRAQGKLGKLEERDRKAVLVTGMVIAGIVFGAAVAVVAAAPIQENLAVAAQLDQAYEPFEEDPSADTLVFLPTPYGDWLGHPFQALRNEPGFNGRTVYALEKNQFRVIDAFPDRSIYRYTYRGQWAPVVGSAVEPRLQPVRVVSGEQIEVVARVGVPSGTDRVTIQLQSDTESAYYVLNSTASEPELRVKIVDDRVWVTGPIETVGTPEILVSDRDEIRVDAFVEYGAGSGFHYRIEIPIDRRDGAVRALTPYLEVCHVPALCGGESAYLPNSSESGVFIETTSQGY